MIVCICACVCDHLCLCVRVCVCARVRMHACMHECLVKMFVIGGLLNAFLCCYWWIVECFLHKAFITNNKPRKKKAGTSNGAN